jgi:hypothetical protein
MTAIDLRLFDRGRTPSFFKRTIDSWAIRRASRACSGASFTLYGVRA